MLSASFAASGVNHFAMATRVHERRSPEVGRQREEGACVCVCVGSETRLCERAQMHSGGGLWLVHTRPIYTIISSNVVCGLSWEIKANEM